MVKDRLYALFPGLAISAIVAFAALYLGEHYGAPVTLYALLLGLALHFLAEDGGRCRIGIDFAAKHLLRIGVALLGLQISASEIVDLGGETIAMVIAGTVLTIALGVALSLLAGKGKNFGVLTGSAVAICGASAAVAVASVLSKKRISKEDVLFTVVSVTTLSTIAMIVYPVLMAGMGMDERTTGILLGGTIHDVAQVVGAGYAVSETTGHIATAVKLFRVSLLFPVVVILAYMLGDGGQSRLSHIKRIPGFAIGFAVLVGVNSLGIVPPLLHESLGSLSRWLLVTAIAALGMLTSLQALMSLGGRYIAIVIGETVGLLAIVMVALFLFTSH